ncbi:MAG: CheR family methyltransferase [Pseudanabaena sp. ELA607]
MITIPQAVLDKLKSAITERLGIYVRPQDDATFCKKIHIRVQFLKISTYESYCDFLNCGTEQSESEWRELIRQITIAETYFMRDKGHIHLLQNNILPEIIRAQHPQKTLRIWSAGCSTGEEAYSLAILLHELIPDIDQWRLRIIGSDLNPDVIQKARQGVYSDWSLRSLTDKQKKLYFTAQGSLWRLQERICQMVTFYSNNLVDDAFAQYAADFYNFDLILCRNVFIYFEPKSIEKVLRRFYTALKSNAYLITGHMELHGQNLNGFKVKVFPDAVVYQKNDQSNRTISPQITVGSSTSEQDLSYPSSYPVDKSIDSSSNYNSGLNDYLNGSVNPAHTPHPNSEDSRANLSNTPSHLSGSYTWESYSHASRNLINPLPSQPKDSSSNHSSNQFTEIRTDWDRLAAAESAMNRAGYREALRYLDQIQEKRLHFLKIHQLSALAHANLGELKPAYEHCEEVIKLEPNSPKIYYLMAHIADEMGKYDEVKQLLKKAIYLDLYFVAAYLALGDMYGRESDRDRALKMYRSTIDILKALPSQEMVPETDLTPLELIPQVEERMRWIGVGFSL